MPLELLTIPCLSDNYAFVIHNQDSGEAALIDAPQAAPINAALAARGITLTTVLLTHHHDDHVMGISGLDGPEPSVIGAAADAHRLPPLTRAIAPGDELSICGASVQIIDVPGHTLGHVAYYVPDAGMLFSGDSLMAMGCGRLFEGTPAQMWSSLQKLRALPGDTVVCSGHEYTTGNARFALSLEPDNPRIISRAEATEAARAAGMPTVPSTLSLEIATNPFLRADDPALAAAIGMAGANPTDVFAETRARKDRF